MITYSTKSENIDWDHAVNIFLRAPLGKHKRDPEKLEKAFESSYAVLYAFDKDKLVGMGRALCDGEYQAAIYDMVVLPEYQGKGIGTEIIERLCDQLPVENIILYAVPGRESFYEKCEFKIMRTAMAKLSSSMSSTDSGYLK